MGVEDELIWMSFSAQNLEFRFSEIFAIVNSILSLQILAKID